MMNRFIGNKVGKLSLLMFPVLFLSPRTTIGYIVDIIYDVTKLCLVIPVDWCFLCKLFVLWPIECAVNAVTV